LNPENKLGCGGIIAKQYAGLLEDLYNPDAMNHVNPSKFRRAAGRQRSEFAGYEQHDSQEFLMFLLDKLSEDLSRIGEKPYFTIPDSTDAMVHDRNALEEFGKTCWKIYEARNSSVITDLFSGMYKSTLICPDCHKTSFIMDPFSTLTLPIPAGSQPLTRKITFVPRDGPPVCLVVRLESSDTLKTWKDFVGEKMGIDGRRIFAAESYDHTFFKTFQDDDSSFESLETTQNDTIVFYDLGPVSASNDDDKIIVPVFHRKIGPRKNKMANRNLFGLPSILCLSHEEAGDFETIYRELLEQSSNMTTCDMFNEQSTQDEHATDDSDTVIMNEDDAQSADSRIKTTSVDGDNSIVDISMHDAQIPKVAENTEVSDSNSDSQSIKTPQHPLAGKIPANLLALFEAKVMSDKKAVSDNKAVPEGRNMDKDLPLLASRIHSLKISNKVCLTSLSMSLCELLILLQDCDSASHGSADNSDEYSDTDASDIEPHTTTQLLRHGDAIVLDWTAEAFDVLFSVKNKASDQLRGVGTYNSPKTVFDQTRLSQPKKTPSVTLDECLDVFSKAEVLSRGDTWYCPDCKNQVQATKKFNLWKAPDVMIIQLKRFSHSQFGRFNSKITTLVDFPLEGLDLTGRVQGPSDGKSLLYDLVAIDNHMGSLSGGHYTAYIKDFMSGKWYYCNGQISTTQHG
jgi:ubiquitin carboxyl-terminal hydrolase 4/11/15